MSNIEIAFGRGLSKKTQDILKDKQQRQLNELKSMRETLDNFMKDQNSREVIKNNGFAKRFLINFLKLTIIGVVITAITLMIIFGLSNI
jgi:F0F1-type ATP synthase assembly protein I